MWKPCVQPRLPCTPLLGWLDPAASMPCASCARPRAFAVRLWECSSDLRLALSFNGRLLRSPTTPPSRRRRPRGKRGKREPKDAEAKKDQSEPDEKADATAVAASGPASVLPKEQPAGRAPLLLQPAVVRADAPDIDDK